MLWPSKCHDCAVRHVESISHLQVMWSQFATCSTRILQHSGCHSSNDSALQYFRQAARQIRHCEAQCCMIRHAGGPLAAPGPSDHTNAGSGGNDWQTWCTALQCSTSMECKMQHRMCASTCRPGSASISDLVPAAAQLHHGSLQSAPQQD